MAPRPKTSSPPPELVDSFVDLADRVGVGLVVSTHDLGAVGGRIAYANLAACRLLGVAARDIIIDQTLDAARIANASFTSSAGAKSSTQDPRTGIRGELTREDGQRIVIHWSRVRSETAEASIVVHFLAPVERAARIEQALHDSEQRFRRLIDIAPDGIVVTVGTRIVYANQAIMRIHGYSDPHHLSQLGLEHLFCNEDRQLIQQATAHSPSTQVLQLRAIRRDGSMAPVEAVLFRTEWDDNPAVLMAIRDLAGRRLIQSQLVHTDRLAAVGTLAAGVAHEINNPLAYVLLNLQYLIRELPKLTANQDRLPHLVERLREARHGAERVVAIVKDLRAFSRIDEDQMGQVDLRRVLLGAIKVAKTQLMECGQ
ncbi:MAG TPA: PAS domain S-box protein, partial [Polyangiaceae bacterium]|nr:PAS domain S-box protein [Polyangiaceae bacterium]